MCKNLKELMTKYSDENVCRDFMVQQRWGGVPECPYCGCKKSYKIENGKRFKCAERTCYKKYSVTVGTVFEASNIPLTTWFPAMYLILSHKKGISSIQLSKDLGVTQKTAWFMLHRIREFMKEKNSPMLGNTVEIDETFMGGHTGNKSLKKRAELKAKGVKGYMEKTPVMGMIERGGKLRANVVSEVNQITLQPMVKSNVEDSAVVITDNFWGYRGLDQHFSFHQVINHTFNEYVNGDIHTNTIEGFWSLLKRGVYGIYHQVSPKHLQRYVDEYAFRYNSRQVKDGDRFVLSLANVNGRLTYKQLVQDGKSKKEGNPKA